MFDSLVLLYAIFHFKVLTDLNTLHIVSIVVKVLFVVYHLVDDDLKLKLKGCLSKYPRGNQKLTIQRN